jgi:hypothetical protein
MNFKDFRVGLRLLMRDPLFSIVAVLGLGLGLAASLLLLGFVRYSWQYDAHVPDVDQVYVVKQRQNLELGAPWFDQAPTLLRAAALESPGVAQASGFVSWIPLTLQSQGQLRKVKSLTVMPGFAELLGLQVIKGDLSAALTRQDGLAITEAAALRIFGSADVLGRTVHAASVNEQSASLRIAAIVRTPPASTTIPFESLIGAGSALVPKDLKDEMLNGAGGWWGRLLVRVRPGASLDAVTASLQRAIDRAPAVQNVPPEARASLGQRKVMDIQLAPLREAYFDTVASGRFALEADRGDARVVAGLAAVAILILALAVINYANLATIRVIRRQREFSMRKVLGASTSRLVLQIVAESLLVAMLATAVGVLMAWLALPLFGELMNRDLGSMLSLQNLASAALVGILSGLLTAIYPVWIVFRMRPSEALAGRPDAESLGSKRMRQLLAMTQIAAAMGLASFTMAVAWQTSFAIGASPGFDPSPLLILDLPEPHVAKSSAQARGFMAALAREQGVAGVAVSADAVGRSKNIWSTDMKREGGSNVAVDIKSVSAGFFAQYGIKPLAGRLFDANVDQEDDPVPVVINAIAARQFGFASPEQALGQTLLFRGPGGLSAKRVIGIAPEVRFYSLREAPRATAYELWTAGPTLTIRARAPLAEVEQVIRAIWPQYFPNAPLEMRPARDIFAANYADDARLAGLLVVATAIALVIAAVGAYVLAADAVQRRGKEIALRKLHGAQRRHIGKLIAMEIGMMLLIPAAVALPVAAVAIQRYQSAYVEQAQFGYWPLVAALAAGVATAACAAARHSWMAMGLHPSVALRS